MSRRPRRFPVASCVVLATGLIAACGPPLDRVSSADLVPIARAAEPEDKVDTPCGVTSLEDWTSTGAFAAALVSVDAYANPAWNLLGPANDMDALCEVLRDGWDVPGAAILRLSDEGATHAAISAALQRLAEPKNRKGHSLVFAFAGHGSRFEDEVDGDEGGTDSLDETLCPHDRDTAGDLLDDDLFAWTQDILSTGAHLVQIFDSCHSGAVSRGDASDPANQMGDDAPLVRRLELSTTRVPTRSRTKAHGAARVADRRHVLDNDERIVRLSATAATQLAGEGPVRRREAAAKPFLRGRHGYFSAALVTSLAEAAERRKTGETPSWDSIWGAVVERVPEPQRPEASGSLRRAIFGTTDVVREPHAAVSAVLPAKEADRPASIQISWGALSGVGENALLAVYAQGSELAEATFKGYYRVPSDEPAAVSARSATAHWWKGEHRGEPERGDVVLVLSGGGASQQRAVWIGPRVPGRTALEGLVREDARFALVEGDARSAYASNPEALAVFVSATAPQCVWIEGGPSTWPVKETRSKTDCSITDPATKAVSTPDAFTYFDVLVDSVNWERFHSIRNDTATSVDVGDVLEVRLERVRIADRAARTLEVIEELTPNADGAYALDYDDIVRLSYRVLGDTPWFVSATYLSNERSVFALNPVLLGKKTQPGAWVTLDAVPIQVGPPAGIDLMKLFVVDSRRFDPSPFVQKGTIGKTRGAWLDADAPAFAESRLVRGGRNALAPSVAPERWGTMELKILIEPPPEHGPATK